VSDDFCSCSAALEEDRCTPLRGVQAVPERVWTIDAVGLDSLDAVLNDEHVLDEVYRLVVMLMRQGLNPLRRHHNHPFAGDVLRTSAFIPITS
jgi:hypothetical protein